MSIICVLRNGDKICVDMTSDGKQERGEREEKSRRGRGEQKRGRGDGEEERGERKRNIRAPGKV